MREAHYFKTTKKHTIVKSYAKQKQENEYLFKIKYFILHGEIKEEKTLVKNTKKRNVKARRQ